MPIRDDRRLAAPAMIAAGSLSALLVPAAITIADPSQMMVIARSLIGPIDTQADKLLWVHTFNLYLWHIPFLYQGVLTDTSLHVLEHLLFLGTGILLWMPLFGPLPKPPASRRSPTRASRARS